jgi:hypothetical protein
MSTKAKASAKKSPAKAATQKAVDKKTDKKTDKNSAATPVAAAGKKGKAALSEIDEVKELSAAPVNNEEEAEDEDERASSSSGGVSAAALAAAAASPAEGPGSLKNFRHHPDMENFYRFIYENDLRLEALHILDEMMEQRGHKKITKQAKSQAH